MTTVPGFSSRSTTSTVRHLPQRDEAAMTTPGFSNSKPDHESRVLSTEVVAAPLVEGAEATAVTAPAPKKATRKSRAEGK